MLRGWWLIHWKMSEGKMGWSDPIFYIYIFYIYIFLNYLWPRKDYEAWKMCYLTEIQRKKNIHIWQVTSWRTVFHIIVIFFNSTCFARRTLFFTVMTTASSLYWLASTRQAREPMRRRNKTRRIFMRIFLRISSEVDVAFGGYQTRVVTWLNIQLQNSFHV